MIGSGALSGIVVLVGIVLGVVLIICWIVLPWAIIGTKPLLRELLAEQRRTNELLARTAPQPPDPRL